jgi:nicotinamidase-related amidase
LNQTNTSSGARALIVVDLQRGFVNEHTRHIIEPIERFQAGFAHVIATRFYRRTDSVIHRLLSIEGFERGSPDTELAFTPKPGTEIIEKCSYSCVTPELAEQLRGWGVDEAYVCGVDTDQCVLMIAADLLQNDIVPVVCEDLTASAAGSEYHERGLFLLRRLIGKEQVRAAAHR